jgi:pyrroloquinoline-quinone synthase
VTGTAQQRAVGPGEAPPLARDEFVAHLKREGASRYHSLHPFNVAMHAGRLTRDELRRWVINRYYYQTRIPIKDALILSKSDDPAFRRRWIRRIGDHDGRVTGGATGGVIGGPDERLESRPSSAPLSGERGESRPEPSEPEAGGGGLAEWLFLARAVGLDMDEVRSLRRVLPGVRYACDSYVELVRERSLVEAVASSLTEHFAPEIMRTRVAAWEKHYPWVDTSALAYFRSRVPRATRDSEEALAFVVEHATTRAAQEACARALVDKCRILWAMLDAIAESAG